jgi:hypothetical protein
MKSIAGVRAFWEQFPSGVRGWLLVTLVAIVLGICLRVNQLMAGSDTVCPNQADSVCPQDLEEQDLLT